MPDQFTVVPLTASHDRKRFSCGVSPLDRYLHELVTQDIRRCISNCFVACDAAGTVAGYYTLSAASLPLSEVTAEETRRLPRYGILPAALVGRLAIDLRFRGHGLGGALVIDAVRRAAGADPAILALVVDAKDDDVVAFYEHLGFRQFGSRPMSLYLPIATALKALQAASSKS